MKKEALLKAIDTDGAQIRGVAALLSGRGWAEANGGNISLRLMEHLEPKGETSLLHRAYPELEGQCLLFKTAGSRMRDLAENPLGNLCLVKITDQGKSYVIESSDGHVTSEFASHLAVHAVLAGERPGDRALLHTHPTHIIALSHLVHDPTELRDTLIRMFPEAALLLHNNLHVLSYLTPGSEELAEATADAARHARAVVWSTHGMLVTGENLSAAFDLVEVTDKAAHIALLLKDNRKKLGLSQKEIENLFT